MTQIMQKEIDRLKKQLLSLCAVVEDHFEKSIAALERRDAKIAAEVLGSDDRIDEMEVDLEEECLKVLALHQPVAIDLRFLVAVLKINNDLERIGDLAANIAERAVALSRVPEIVPPFDVAEMADVTHKMLEMSLQCLVEFDPELAGRILAMDDTVDHIHAGNFQRIKDRILADVSELDALTQYLTVSRHLERIADLATNIAEDVYYMIEGEIVRHSEDWLKR